MSQEGSPSQRLPPPTLEAPTHPDSYREFPSLWIEVEVIKEPSSNSPPSIPTVLLTKLTYFPAEWWEHTVREGDIIQVTLPRVGLQYPSFAQQRLRLKSSCQVLKDGKRWLRAIMTDRQDNYTIVYLPASFGSRNMRAVTLTLGAENNSRRMTVVETVNFFWLWLINHLRLLFRRAP